MSSKNTVWVCPHTGYKFDLATVDMDMLKDHISMQENLAEDKKIAKKEALEKSKKHKAQLLSDFYKSSSKSELIQNYVELWKAYSTKLIPRKVEIKFVSKPVPNIYIGTDVRITPVITGLSKYKHSSGGHVIPLSMFPNATIPTGSSKSYVKVTSENKELIHNNQEYQEFLVLYHQTIEDIRNNKQTLKMLNGVMSEIRAKILGVHESNWWD